MITHPDVRSWLYAYALSLTMSLSDTERLHAVNGSFCKTSSGTTTFENMAANAINRNAVSASRSIARRNDSSEAPTGSGWFVPPPARLAIRNAAEAAATSTLVAQTTPLAPRAPKSSVLTKGKSAFEVFRADFIVERRGLGDTRNVCGAAFWADVKVGVTL